MRPAISSGLSFILHVHVRCDVYDTQVDGVNMYRLFHVKNRLGNTGALQETYRRKKPLPCFQGGALNTYFKPYLQNGRRYNWPWRRRQYVPCDLMPK